MNAEWKVEVSARSNSALLQTVSDTGHSVTIECSAAGFFVGAGFANGTKPSVSTSESIIALDGMKLTAESSYVLGNPPIAFAFQFSNSMETLESLAKSKLISMKVGETTIEVLLDLQKAAEFSRYCQDLESVK